MSFTQIIIAFFALCYWVYSLKKIYTQGTVSVLKVAANTVIWVTVITFMLFPNIAHDFSVALGFGENLNTLIFIGFIVVFMLFFRLLNIVEALESQISHIVTENAIAQFKHENKKHA